MLLGKACLGMERRHFSSESYLPNNVLRALPGSEGESDLPKVTQLGGGKLDLNPSCWTLRNQDVSPHSPSSTKLAAFVEGQRCAQACLGVSGRLGEKGQPCWQDRTHLLLLLFITTL